MGDKIVGNLMVILGTVAVFGGLVTAIRALESSGPWAALIDLVIGLAVGLGLIFWGTNIKARSERALTTRHPRGEGRPSHPESGPPPP